MYSYYGKFIGTGRTYAIFEINLMLWICVFVNKFENINYIIILSS